MNELDTSRAYETPEGIILELKIAGPVVRACAWAIDAAIRLVIYIVIPLVFSFFGGLGMAVTLIGFFLIEWFYPVLFEVHSGATPGKKAMGINVIHDNGTPISWSSSLIRNLLRAADFFPFMYGAGLLTMLANRDFKRLGDLAAGTLVVYRDKATERYILPEIAPRPPPPELTIDELRTFLEFSERSERISTERLVELAEVIAEMTGKRREVGVNEIHAYANWLAKGG